MFHYAHLEATLVLSATFFAATICPAIALALCGLCLLPGRARAAAVDVPSRLGRVHLLAIWRIGRSRAAAPDRSQVLVVVAALVVVTALYAKNLKEFGVFSSSSWQGLSSVSMSLPVRAGDAGAFPAVADDFRSRLQRGDFSPSAALAFEAANFWAGWLPMAKGCVAGERLAAALCSMRKSNGEENFNNIAIIRYSSELGRDAVHGVRLYPAFYARRVASSFMTFFGTPSWSYAKPGPALRAYGAAWNRLLMFAPVAPSRPTGATTADGRCSPALPVGVLPLCALVLVITIFIVARGSSRRVYLRGRRAQRTGYFCAGGRCFGAAEFHQRHRSRSHAIRSNPCCCWRSPTARSWCDGAAASAAMALSR